MKVLIVDDDLKRSEEVKKIIFKNEEVVSCIDTEESLIGAKKALKNRYYDVLIMDIVIPLRVGQAAKGSNGIDLLKIVNDSPFIKKPESIIGITGYKNDISVFREEFEKKCLVILEVSLIDDRWKNSLLISLKRTAESKVARLAKDSKYILITVHGIRTFGHWQSRLKDLVAGRADFFEYHSYRYGYFSAFSFLFPFLRNKEVERLRNHLHPLVDSGKDVYIFSHSFGTYLVAHSVKKLVELGCGNNIRVIIFAGSVLARDFDWGFLNSENKIRVINDCGDLDYILTLSEALVLGVGMAGKTGFIGFDNDRVINRYFSGGHSHYFDGDDFMRNRWLPIIFSSGEVKQVDQRKISIIRHEVCDQLAIFLGSIKSYIYFFIFITLILYFFA